ncbi:copper-sensing transcription factor [Purpureocillium lavendulum]|uniref:Copper-sensing transcription factor n=1 Tax=Purpureocillium lavendulum TaxID=1247861 RepID=A0AB34FR75_9HYPO|nr:copper-sensing transcription factor [Purpureocillium lavendulum]
MPLINGQKMACEPCIRGHRSTKCTHANERLMVPVRKPGRPLSSCPHPSSRPCSCAAVTAAIPRKQKCRCGTSEPAPAETKSDKDAANGELTPPSPSKATSSAFRVQKQASRGGSSRKQSIDIAGLERMDAGQINILPAYNGLHRPSTGSNGHTATMPELPMYPGLGLSPAEGSFRSDSGMFPVFHQYPMQPPLMGTAAADPSTNGHGVTSTTRPTTSNGNGISANGGCCGGGANGVKSEPAPQQVAIPVPAANEGVAAKARSCCSAPQATPKTSSPSSAMSSPPLSHQTQPNGIMMQPYQPLMAMPNGMYPYFSQPTIFNYPPQFGSFLQPLQPDQWRQIMATMNFGQPVAPSGFAMPAAGTVQPPTVPNSATWTSHQCSCGDSCQCVGCAAHPYNEATQNYVRSAWNTMVEDGQKMQAQHGGHTNHVNGHHERSGSRASNGVPTPVTTQADGTISPPAPQTPSDAPSGASEEQTLSANDFFFVSYPFGDSCAGDTTSCPCGDDCQCIGCVIHNNPGPDETREHPSL